MNSSPQAVKFANEKVRPMADLLYTSYQSAKAFIQLWNTQQIGTLIPFDGTVIDDGATADGRPPMSNAQAEQIYNLCTNLISWMERGTLDGSGTQNNAALNNVTAVQVNGISKF